MAVNRVLFKKRREELGLTQEKLEAATGITQGTISYIEGGRAGSLTTKVIIKLARGLQIKPDDKLFQAIFLS